jgi:hypothetical protein
MTTFAQLPSELITPVVAAMSLANKKRFALVSRRTRSITVSEIRAVLGKNTPPDEP